MDVFSETMRYLGWGRQKTDTDTEIKVRECIDIIKNASSPKNVFLIEDISVSDGIILSPGLKIKSKNLSKNLMGCKKAVFMAATLGAGADAAIRRLTKTDMPMAVMADAAATALIEAYCDEICAGFKERGYNLRPRFSPGYGDFDISYQRDFMNILQCAKKIGLTVTEGLMLAPSKSVTAVMGIGGKGEHCEPGGCEVCGNKNCLYRRD